jgi:hypothetical protein
MTFVSDSFILFHRMAERVATGMQDILTNKHSSLACAHFKHQLLPTAIGSVMCLNASVLPVFDQLGLTKEIVAASKPIREFNFFRGSMKKLGHYSDYTALERYHFGTFFFSLLTLLSLAFDHNHSNHITFCFPFLIHKTVTGMNDWYYLVQNYTRF